MPSAWITRRVLPSGARKWVVRYRLGGGSRAIHHAGSFATKRLAERRLAWVREELAEMRVPDLREHSQAATVLPPTLAQAAERWLASRIDAAPETRKGYASHLARIVPAFGDRDPGTIVPDDVQAWVAAIAQELSPASVRRYLATLRQILDRCTDPNPARDKDIRLPRSEHTIVEPPTAAHFAAMLEHVPPRRRLPLVVLEQTGMRVGELAELVWGDVDVRDSRWRVRSGKTAAARRWVPVPEPVMAAVLDSCPPDDRAPARHVFGGFTQSVAHGVMRRACTAAGIPAYHPHDLRHRYVSRQHRAGVPWAQIAAWVGHSRTSLTADTYSHVLLDD